MLTFFWLQFILELKKTYLIFVYKHRMMIHTEKFNKEIDLIINNALREDVGDGDHSSLACIPKNAEGSAKLLVKDNGIIAGVDFAQRVFETVDSQLQTEIFIPDGNYVRYGDIAMIVKGNIRSILMSERLVLNAIQRMSAIATQTYKFVKILENTNTKILDTRKTTPGIRALEKWAVSIGGGNNHRFGLYDMIMLKDNHIDFAGGIEKAILKTNQYLLDNNLDLKIEIETRNLDEVKEVMRIGKIDRIMLDNFSFEDLKTAVDLINGKYETEASGGITEKTLLQYANCGVDYISSGALTHSVSNMDFSLKAISN